MKTILEVSQLSKKFGPFTAVQNISFKIEKGRVYGMLGPNGSGKSTTLGMVLNVVNPTQGTYRWFEGSCNNQEALKRIGAIIERPNFYPSMSAYDNLKLVCKIKEIPHDKIKDTLDLVGLLDRSDSPFNTYSLGMKQRLAIASALLNDPEILILDEPTNGLDPQGIRQIRDIIKKIAANGTTILLASHLLDEVEKVCSHVIVLRKGQMLYQGSVAGMSQNHGTLTIAAQDKKALHTFLTQASFVKEIEEEQDDFVVYLSEEVNTTDINKMAFDRGIVLSKLLFKKISLEDQFIHLTNQN